MARFGMTVPFDDRPLSDQPAAYAELEAAGYTDLWSSEVSGADVFGPLTVAALAAPSVRLGTAIVPAFTRGPAVIAMQAATLAGLAPGRFVLGVGPSSDVIVHRWNGIAFDRPLSRTRDVVRFLRDAFTGERVTATYDTFAIDGFRLMIAPDEPPPVLVAALREGMLRVGATDADGVILNWLSADDVIRAKSIVDDAAGGSTKEIVARIFVIPTEDADVARTMARRELTTYFNVPVYAEFAKWLGKGDVFAPMWAAWDAGDRKGALAALSDELVDSLVVHGSPEACRAHVQRYVDNGVTTPVLRVLPSPGLDSTASACLLAP